MSQFYASQADAVADFMQNYTDEQAQGIEDMTDAVSSQATAAWKENADRATAKAEGQAELGGQLVGGVLGIKGLKAGYGKIKDIYGKYKQLKQKGQELKKKLAPDDEDEEVEPQKDDPANVDKEEGDSKIDSSDDPVGTDDTYHTAPYQTGEEDSTENSASTEANTEGTDPGELGSTEVSEGGGGFSADDGSIPDINWDDLANTSIEDFGKWFRGNAAQINANIEKARGRITKALNDDDEAQDTTTSNPVATNDAPVSDRPLNLDDFENMSSEEMSNFVTGVRQAGTQGVDLDAVFNEPAFEGGQLEGTFQAVPEEVAQSIPKVPRIGDGGNVEDVLSRPSADVIESRTTTQTKLDPEGQGEDDVPNAFMDEPKPSVGGAQELDVYSADVPSSYTEAAQEVSTTQAEAATEGFTGLQDFSQARSLGGTFFRGQRTFDLDQPEIVDRPDFSSTDTQPPTAEPEPTTAEAPSVELPDTTGAGEFTNPLFRRPDLDVGDVRPQTDAITESNITADQEGTQSTINASRLPAGEDVQADTAGYGDVIDNAVQGNLENLSKNLGSKVSDVASKVIGGDVEGAAETAGSALAETLGGEAAGEAAAGIGSAVLGAIPVVGEVAGIGVGLYEGIKGLVDLFEKKKGKPPTPKELTGVPQTDLQTQNTALTAKLTSGIPTATNDISFDSSGIMSF